MSDVRVGILGVDQIPSLLTRIIVDAEGLARVDCDVFLQPPDPSILHVILQMGRSANREGMFVTYAGGPPEPEQLGYGRRDISEIANRLAEIFRIVLRAGYPAWNESSEALITALERLLAQKERLQEAYMLLFKDLETARQRIHTLELQYESLLDQRSRTPEGWRSPKVILGIAGIVATLVAPVITVASEHAFSASANRVLEQAMTVERDCNKTIINNYTVTAPTDAATGSVSPAAGQLGRTQLGTTPLGGAPGATSPPAASGIGSAPYGTQPYGGY